MNATETTLVRHQTKKYGPKHYIEDNTTYRITAEVRYDDECNNGHNSFTITADIDRRSGNRWVEHGGGCCHDEIVKHFPELVPLIKWHLCSSDGPMHYPANVTYHAGDRDCWGLRKGKERNLDHARSCAIWPEATDAILLQDKKHLEASLLDRLPALLDEFQAAVESLGFTY